MLKFFALYKRKITDISNTAFYNQIGISIKTNLLQLLFLLNSCFCFNTNITFIILSNTDICPIMKQESESKKSANILNIYTLKTNGTTIVYIASNLKTKHND
jgi:predicted lactoylglutathione lyase